MERLPLQPVSQEMPFIMRLDGSTDIYLQRGAYLANL